MTKLNYPDNCGNSPKSLVVLDFYTHLFKFDYEKIGEMVTEDFSYQIYGDHEYKGKKELHVLMADIKNSRFKEFEVKLVISHGKYVVATGHAKLEDKTKIVFSETFTFDSHATSAKISRIESYNIIV